MRIMALDLGEKRIGIAVSDDLLLTAQGLCVIETRGIENDLERVGELAAEREISQVVIGLPRNMNGSFGPMAEKVQDFGRRLATMQPQLSISYWDERLTTSAAQKALLEANLSRKRRRQVVDKVAAVLILQGYLDATTRR